MARKTWGESNIIDKETITSPIKKEKSKKRSNKNSTSEPSNQELELENEIDMDSNKYSNKDFDTETSTDKKADESKKNDSEKQTKKQLKKGKKKDSKTQDLTHPTKDTAKPSKEKKIKRGEQKESAEWKLQAKKYKSARQRMRFLGTIIVVLLILAIVVGYVYFFQLDTDGDGEPDVTDDDDDGDGIPDFWEEHHGLNPKDDSDAHKDKDGDGLNNWNEYRFQSDPSLVDSDNDELNDWEEWNIKNIYGKSTDPKNQDTDHDGMHDGWEWRYDLNPTIDDAGLDTDQDGYDVNHNGILEVMEYYTNLEEYEETTNPRAKDSDSDGMWDGWEIYFRGECLKLKSQFLVYLLQYNYTFDPTSPLETEEDIDAITTNTIPELAPDSLTNFQEFHNSTDPTKPDSDGDFLTDYEEIVIHGTNPVDLDTDDDLLWDGWEASYGGKSVGLDPKSNDTNKNGLLDRFEDLDNDGLDNNREFFFGTSPISWDTDLDGLPDGWEVNNNCLDPLLPNYEDADGDKLSDMAEFENGTNPCDNDTDDDGLNDGEELMLGFHGIFLKGEYYTGIDAPCYYTDATNNDTDNDGILDGSEIENKMNASNPDTDHDGLFDKIEYQYGTNPIKQDTDGDKLNDWEEVNLGNDGYFTLPTVNDTDGDGLLDGDEVLIDYEPFILGMNITDPTDTDTDKDGMTDGWEGYLGFTNNLTTIKNFDKRYGTNYAKLMQSNTSITRVWLVSPVNPDDAEMDADFDGYDSIPDKNIEAFEQFKNSDEFKAKTNPVLWDTDGDGMSDGWEDYYFLDPNDDSDKFLDNVDRDGIEYYVNKIKYIDNFTNFEEYRTGIDTNGDGIIDHGTTDPTDPNSDNIGGEDYDDIWYGDYDHDGLYNGWEMLFNGTPYDLEGFGYNPAFDPDFEQYKGRFNPKSNDSDNNGIQDGNEDYDNDTFSNKKEQGDVLNKPGSSDPTDPEMTPETIILGSRSVEHPSSTPHTINHKSETNQKVGSPASSSNIYAENIYENWLITLYYFHFQACDVKIQISPSRSIRTSFSCLGDIRNMGV